MLAAAIVMVVATIFAGPDVTMGLLLDAVAVAFHPMEDICHHFRQDFFYVLRSAHILRLHRLLTSDSRSW